jgi:tetratricopeptide (TPR) repeat protein
MAKVYVSSTILDLESERRAVMEWLLAARHQAVHSYLPSSETVRDSCLDDVDACDLYVLILGHRYGFQPLEGNPEKLSITHLEFQRAGHSGIPRIVLLRTNIPEARLSDLEDPQRAPLILAFRAKVQLEVRPAEFNDPKGLIQGLSTGVQSELDKLRARIEEKGRPHSNPGQRVVGHRVFDNTRSFQGRIEKARELGQLLAQPTTKVVSVIGRAGIGKTALASKVLADLDGNHWPHTDEPITVDGVVHLSMQTAGISLDRLFRECGQMLGGEREEALNKVLGDNNKTPADKVEALLKLLADGLYFIFLDRMDSLIDDEGRIKDPGLQSLFDRSLAASHGPRLLITCRDWVAFQPDSMQFVEKLELVDGLLVPEGVAMLRSLDPSGQLKLREMRDDRLGEAVNRLHGVPRDLQLLAQRFRDERRKSLEEIVGSFYERGGVVSKIIEEGYQRIDKQERLIVEALAVLGRPVLQEAVEFVVAPFAPGLNVDGVLDRLTLTCMVTADRANKTVALDSIDKEYAYSQLPDQGDYSRSRLEQLAGDFYAKLRPPRERWKVFKDIDPMLFEFEHRVKAGDYDAAAELLGQFDVDYLIQRGHSETALKMRQLIDGKIVDRRLQMHHIYSLACAHMIVGPVLQGMDELKQSLALARELGDSLHEVKCTGYLGGGSRRLGRLDDAMGFLDQALRLLHDASDQHGEAGLLGELSLVCSYRGYPRAALGHAERALTLADELNDMEARALAYDSLSLAYLVLGRLDEVLQYADKAIDTYRKSAWEHSLIYVLNVQGLAHLALGHIDVAIDLLERARSQAQLDHDTRVEGLASFNLAWAYRWKKDAPKALEASTAAKSIFTRIGGGEAAAAVSLADAILAANGGDKRGEAEALLACARASIKVPDLHNPNDLAEEVLATAQAEGWRDLLGEAQVIIDELHMLRTA